MTLTRAACPLLLLGLLFGLVRMGDERLTVPLHSLPAFTDWLNHTQPADMAAAMLRQTGIVIAAYLLLATTLALVAQALGYRRLALVLLRAGLPRSARTLVTGTAGLGFAAGTVVLSTPSQAGAGQPIATAVAAEPPRAVFATMTLLGDGSEPATVDTATMALLDSPPAVEAATPSELALPGESVSSAADDDWIVGPGDSFWAIAEELLDELHGPGQGELDVATYCRQLIDANHDRLARPDHPDLLFPGQVLTVPPPAT